MFQSDERTTCALRILKVEIQSCLVCRLMKLTSAANNAKFSAIAGHFSCPKSRVNQIDTTFSTKMRRPWTRVIPQT